jgi:hypothetical protein
LRTLATTTAGVAGITGVLGPFNLARAAIDPGERGIKITNMTVATIRGLNSTGRIVRLDTNKGISGYGECRVEDINAANELNRVRSTVSYRTAFLLKI